MSKMRNCKDDYQVVYQSHAIPHSMKENVISRMLQDVARTANAPARHSASHDYEKCLFEYGGFALRVDCHRLLRYYSNDVQTGGRGQLVFRAAEIAQTMIIAIVTSREAEPGKSKWLTNNDLTKSFSCRFSQPIRNMAMKKQTIHGILLIYCPKSTIYIKIQTGQLKTR